MWNSSQRDYALMWFHSVGSDNFINNSFLELPSPIKIDNQHYTGNRLLENDFYNSIEINGRQ